MAARDLLRNILLRVRGDQFTSKGVIDFYLATAGRLSILNYWRWKSSARARPARPARLHLGCGPTYLEGWTNVEALFVWRHDLWLDVRHGLPFADGSIDRIYANQFLEHFALRDLMPLLKECHRVLAPGGRVRFVVPSFARAAEAYASGDLSKLESQDRRHRSAGAAVNDFLLCQGHHLVLFDFAFMRELLEEAGPWARIEEPRPGTSTVMEHAERLQSEARWGEIQDTCLVVEAEK